MLTQAPRGTKDILPDGVERWRYVEEKIRELQQKKADLADIATGGENNIMQMDADEIIDLLG